MMILSIISVAVSNLVKTGVETQLSQRMQENMQTIAMNIVDDLRYDIRTADTATISNGGNTLTLTGGTGNIVYSLASGNMRRTVGGGTPKIYNAGYAGPGLEVACLNMAGATIPCFQGFSPSTANPAVFVSDSVDPRQIRVDNITVQQQTLGNTMIDRNFGRPQFALRNFNFDLMSATQFW